MAIKTHQHFTNPALPALVLVHGLGSAGTIWKSLLPQLSEHFTVYPIDLPGHGVAPLDEGEEYDPRSLAQAIVEAMNTTPRCNANACCRKFSRWMDRT